MNKREIFDKVAKHLLDQGKRSKIGIGCSYRGSYGLTCAVGCLIPDDVYTERMEGKSVSDLIITYPKMRKLFGEHRVLLGRLQKLHDEIPVSSWEHQLNDLKESTFVR